MSEGEIPDRVQMSKSVDKHLEKVCSLFESLVGWERGGFDLLSRIDRVRRFIRDSYDAQTNATG